MQKFSVSETRKKKIIIFSDILSHSKCYREMEIARKAKEKHPVHKKQPHKNAKNSIRKLFTGFSAA